MRLIDKDKLLKEEKIPFERVNHICAFHSEPVFKNEPEKGCNYAFESIQGSKVHINVGNLPAAHYVSVAFYSGALYKDYVAHMTEKEIKHFLNENVATRIAEKVFSADQNMTLQDWSNDCKTLFARVINDEICGKSSMQIAENIQADLKTCNNEHDDEEEEDEERASEISENFKEYDDEEDGFDPGDDD